MCGINFNGDLSSASRSCIFIERILLATFALLNLISPQRTLTHSAFDCRSVESHKLALPSKRLCVAKRLGNNGNENQTFQFPFQALVHVVGFEQAIVGVFVEVDGEWFFDVAASSPCSAFTKSVTHPPLLSLWRYEMKMSYLKPEIIEAIDKDINQLKDCSLNYAVKNRE